MNAIAQREQAMDLLLSEIAPDAVYAVGDGPFPNTATVEWFEGMDSDVIRQAAYLSALRLDGPDRSVRCPAHSSFGSRCDRLPVAWALLGHTCGLAQR